MKFTCNKNSLINCLNTVGRAVSTRSAIQALSGILIDAKKGSIDFSATDMEIGVQISMNAEVEELGVVVVPGKLFVDVARNLPADDVVVSLNGSEVEVKSGGAEFKLMSATREDFPPLPKSLKEGMSVPAIEFVGTVQRVVRSASRDESRPILTGILVMASDGYLVMAATDSYRLSVKETALEKSLSGALEANVPARAMQELSRIVGERKDSELVVATERNQIVFSVDNVVLSSRLIEGQFPNHKQLVPESFDHELVVDGAELFEVVKRVGLMAQKNTPLKVGLEDGRLTLSAKTVDIGEAEESISVRYKGEGLEIGFNPVFLREGLESAGEGDIELKLISSLRPGLINRVEDDGFRYLIMPVRLNV